VEDTGEEHKVLKSTKYRSKVKGTNAFAPKGRIYINSVRPFSDGITSFDLQR
jgi:hypothetical protein